MKYVYELLVEIFKSDAPWFHVSTWVVYSNQPLAQHRCRCRREGLRSCGWHLRSAAVSQPTTQGVEGRGWGGGTGLITWRLEERNLQFPRRNCASRQKATVTQASSFHMSERTHTHTHTHPHWLRFSADPWLTRTATTALLTELKYRKIWTVRQQKLVKMQHVHSKELNTGNKSHQIYRERQAR